jgi:hypothetical protein
MKKEVLLKNQKSGSVDRLVIRWSSIFFIITPPYYYVSYYYYRQELFFYSAAEKILLKRSDAYVEFML